MNRIKVLAIPGSLRSGSYNRAALEAARELAPEAMEIEIMGLDGIPLFNADEERASGIPPAVVRLREALTAADGLLIASPEYNYSITGVLKNAIDWLSRGPESPLDDKPGAILGAGGRFGTLRAQLHLREILFHNRVDLVDSPQVTIEDAADKFDDRLRLTDERHRRQIARLLEALMTRVVSSRDTASPG
jgi:chromate reductase